MNQGKIPLLLAVTSSFLLAGAAARAADDDSTPVQHRTSRAHHIPAPTDDGPGLRSSAALVVDETHSSVLYSKHADVPMPIASITKLMTVMVVTEAGLPMDERLEVTAEDCSTGKGAASRLVVGTVLTRRDLIHLALMASENRAAHALGRNYPGGVDAFVAAMNEKAQALGMSSSHFVEPTGLDSDNVASPEDLSKLVLAASQNAVIRDYSTDSQYSVRIGRRLVEFVNTDVLVRSPSWNIIVQKTGYIAEAGRCLVMQAVIDARTVVIVLLNGYGKNTRIADARRIKKWMDAQLSRTTAANKT
jgi:serine-type D-Ala-D-Ala endopeptidase (penicillin-binding protein 7)